MNKKRVRMKLILEKQEYTEKMNTRNISSSDVGLLGSLMLDAYRDTIDYNGENLDDAICEVQTTLNGKYGPFMEKCSFMVERDGKTISVSIITWFEKVKNPLLAFIMTHPEYKNQGFGLYLLKKSINALLDDGYDELYLVVTNGNEPAQHLFKKMGFQKIEDK